MYETSRGGGPGRLPGAVAGGVLAPERRARSSSTATGIPETSAMPTRTAATVSRTKGIRPGEVPEQVADLVR